jgi:hypothetical protein
MCVSDRLHDHHAAVGEVPEEVDHGECGTGIQSTRRFIKEEERRTRHGGAALHKPATRPTRRFRHAKVLNNGIYIETELVWRVSAVDGYVPFSL